MSIKKKIIFWFLFPSVSIATIAASFCYFYTRKTVEQNIYNQLEIAADNLQENVKHFLQEKKHQTLDFSSDGFIRDYTEEITGKKSRKEYYRTKLTDHLITNKKSLDPNILEVFVIDLNGKVIASTDKVRVGKDVTGKVSFKETMRRGSYISDIHYSLGIKQTSFDVARMFLDKDNKNPIAIIVNRYNGESLKKITCREISELEQGRQMEGLGETGELYIVNRNKLMITESRFIKDVVLKQVVDTEGVRAAFGNGDGMVGIYTGYRGVQVLGVSRYIEDMDWVVLAEKDVSEAFAPIVLLRNFTIGMGIGGIMVVAIVAILIATGITRSVNILVEGTRRISKGDLAYKIDVKSRDEIGLLAVAFNKMTENLVTTTVSKDYVENVMRTMTYSLIVVSFDGTIKKVNNTTCSLLGYTEDELVNKHIRTLFEEEEFKRSGIQDLVKKGFITNVEKTFISKNGKKIPVLFSGSVMHGPSDSGPSTSKSSALSRSEYIVGRDEEGMIQGIVCVATDITKIKRAEEQTRKLSCAVEQSPNTVVITDAKGDIEYVNPKFTQSTGYSFEEVVGKNPRILKLGIQSVEVYKQLWETITSGSEWRGELHNKKKNGQLCWESVLIFPIKNQEGTITHFIALKEDITENKRLKKEKQSMQMKMLGSSKLATLGEMAAGVAHEINQPLTYIRGAIQGIQEDFEMDDVNMESIVKILGKSLKQVDRMTQIIQHLRAFGRADDMEMRDVIIKKVLDNTLLLLGEKMRLSNIVFTLKEDDDVPLIRGNENQLEQVFINLMQNAIYSIDEKEPKGGEVVVVIKMIKKNNRIQIGFSDNGKGISPKNLENIFEPFFTTKPVGKGTGLGLSIIYSIIQSHGGEITCKSKIGKGTTFMITFPAVSRNP